MDHWRTKKSDKSRQFAVARKATFRYDFGELAAGKWQWVLRTHNPLVAGSSPACPTFSTHTSEQVFDTLRKCCENLILRNFYAIDHKQPAQFKAIPLFIDRFF